MESACNLIILYLQVEDSVEEVKIGGTYENNLSSQFGLQFFAKKTKTEEETITDGGIQGPDGKEPASNQIGSFMSRKDKFFTKKVPSPLERTLSFLNMDEDSASDTESLTRYLNITSTIYS